MSNTMQHITTLEDLESYFNDFYSQNSAIINARGNAASWSADEKQNVDNSIGAELEKIDNLCGSLPERVKRNDYGLYRATLQGKILSALQQLQATMQAANRGY